MNFKLNQRLLLCVVLAISTDVLAEHPLDKVPTRTDSAGVPFTEISEGSLVQDAHWVAVYALQYVDRESFHPRVTFKDDSAFRACVLWLNRNSSLNYSGHQVWYSSEQRGDRVFSAVTQTLVVDALLTDYELEQQLRVQLGSESDDGKLSKAMNAAEVLMKPIHQGGMLHLENRDVWYEENANSPTQLQHALLSHLRTLIVMKRLSQVESMPDMHRRRYQRYFDRGLATLVKRFPEYHNGPLLSNHPGSNLDEIEQPVLAAYQFSRCLSALSDDHQPFATWAERLEDYAKLHMPKPKAKPIQPFIISTQSEMPYIEIPESYGESIITRYHSDAVDQAKREAEEALLDRIRKSLSSATSNEPQVAEEEPTTVIIAPHGVDVTADTEVRLDSDVPVFVDVAVGATVTKSPKMYSEHGIENAIDGDEGDNYAAALEAYPLPHVFTIELQKPTKVQHVSIMWESSQNYASYYTVELFNKEGKRVASRRIATGRGQNQTVPMSYPVTASFVRMTILRTVGQPRLLMRKFQVMAEQE